MPLQSLLRGASGALSLIFPAQCVACRELIAEDGVLCGACWRETPFITGPVCDGCGVPLEGDADADALCERCVGADRPWLRARAPMLYRGTARRLVLAFKHGDRLDLVRPAAAWMAGAAEELLHKDSLAVPVPVHWRRLVSRRYNQAALLARELARLTEIDHVPDALIRARGTGTQGGKDTKARHANVAEAISPHPRRGTAMAGRPVLLVDDVLTSGATLTAAADAALRAGAREVNAVVLARVARAP